MIGRLKSRDKFLPTKCLILAYNRQGTIKFVDDISSRAPGLQNIKLDRECKVSNQRKRSSLARDLKAPLIEYYISP